MSRKKKLSVVENVLIGMLKGGVTPYELINGINNAFEYGSFLEECGFECSDKQVKDMYRHIDALLKITKELG